MVQHIKSFAHRCHHLTHHKNTRRVVAHGGGLALVVHGYILSAELHTVGQGAMLACVFFEILHHITGE